MSLLESPHSTIKDCEKFGSASTPLEVITSSYVESKSLLLVSI
jgi:hypothetical protein